MQDIPIYVFSGNFDTTVVPSKQKAVELFFKAFSDKVNLVQADVTHTIYLKENCK